MKVEWLFLESYVIEQSVRGGMIHIRTRYVQSPFMGSGSGVRKT
jgi:hypothetical protein